MRVFRHEERDPSFTRLLKRAVLVVAALGAAACAGRGGPVPYEPDRLHRPRRAGRSRWPAPRSRSERSTRSTSTSSRSNRCPASSRSISRQDRLSAARHRSRRRAGRPMSSASSSPTSLVAEISPVAQRPGRDQGAGGAEDHRRRLGRAARRVHRQGPDHPAPGRRHGAGHDRGRQSLARRSSSAPSAASGWPAPSTSRRSAAPRRRTRSSTATTSSSSTAAGPARCTAT